MSHPKKNPPHTPDPGPDVIHKIPQHHNELVQTILENPCRTLHNAPNDITVYEKSGWNIYVAKQETGQGTMLIVDTSHPNQHSEVGLYQERLYNGRTFIKLHEDYDQFVKEYFAGKLSIRFKVPSKEEE